MGLGNLAGSAADPLGTFNITDHPRESGDPNGAGIIRAFEVSDSAWIPAFAGMIGGGVIQYRRATTNSRLNGNSVTPSSRRG